MQCRVLLAPVWSAAGMFSAPCNSLGIIDVSVTVFSMFVLLADTVPAHFRGIIIFSSSLPNSAGHWHRADVMCA